MAASWGGVGGHCHKLVTEARASAVPRLWGAGPFLSLKRAGSGIRCPRLLGSRLSCGRDMTARGPTRATENISVNSWPPEVKSEAGVAVPWGQVHPPFSAWLVGMFLLSFEIS